jgi:hypothetical protein
VAAGRRLAVDAQAVRVQPWVRILCGQQRLNADPFHVNEYPPLSNVKLSPRYILHRNQN